MKQDKKHVVVLIEDDPVLVNVYKDMLVNREFKVTVASDGKVGLDIVREQKPEIVLLDMLMPGLNGLEFLREFEPKKHPETKVIVFSNLSDPEQMKQTMELGAIKYVVKADLAFDDFIKLLRSVE